MKIKDIIMVFIGLLFLTFVAISIGPIMSQVEEPHYKVIKEYEKYGQLELREYQPLIIAEVELKGNRNEVMDPGFQLLADYIFARKRGEEKVAMTKPVMQQPAIKFSEGMTVSATENADRWKVRFVMPEEYTMETIPQPADERVKLIEVAAKTMLAARFSGSWRERYYQARVNKLEELMKAESMIPVGQPIYAYYNPPWTLPFLRRNEVMWEVR